MEIVEPNKKCLWFWDKYENLLQKHRKKSYQNQKKLKLEQVYCIYDDYAFAVSTNIVVAKKHQIE